VKIADFTFGLSSLLDINLRGNELLTLTASVFDGASNLQAIDLSHNQIKNLQPETFSNLRSLRELNLSFNELHNNTFDRNGVDWVDTMENLRTLDLSNNKLFYYDVMSYEAFSGLVNLETLNLQSNEITIDYGAFASNRNLKTLDFSYNRMTYFDLNFLLSVTSLENLYLSTMAYHLQRNSI
jgi:Leucine-rich repeat (LRR) protein